jgi:TRAP transporter TAXI family solute receptor
MTMRIGTAEPNSTFSSQGLAIAQIAATIGLPNSIEIVEAHSASIENAEKLRLRKIDFGFVAANWIGRAVAGTAPFTAAVDLRMVAPMNVGPMFFIAARDSALRYIDDLRGKRVSVGPQMSGTCQHAHCILQALGMSFSDITPLYLDFGAGADALRKGEIDAQLQCPIPNRVMSKLESKFNLRVLDYKSGALEQALKIFPIYGSVTMRQGQLRGLETDSQQLGVRNVLVTHAEQDKVLVAQLVRLLVEHAAELSRLNQLFFGLSDLFEPLRLDGQQALEFEGVALHEGAIDAYQQLGLLR